MQHDVAVAAQPRTVAYVVSRFPKLTETFVLGELEAVAALGFRVELYPLLRQPEEVVHDEAARWAARAHYQPFVSAAIVRENARLLVRRPRAYLGALAAVVRGTWGSRKLLLGGLAIFPKAVRAAALMERQGVAHVHCHFASHPATAGFVVHRLTGIPYSFTAHGYDIHRETNMLREKVEEAAFVVTISEYNRRLIEAVCGAAAAAKVDVVHCGVDSRAFSPAERARGGPFTILLVAGLEPVKGHEYLIEACRLLAGDGLDLELVLAGDGPERPRVEARLRDSGLGDRVRLLGAVPRPEVVRLLREADVFVLPSVLTPQGDREGIPVVLMEAMASGVPVVASDLSGIPELVEHERTGLLVPPRDAGAIAAAVARVHGDPELGLRLAHAARERVREQFDLGTNAAAVAERFAR
ncbi:MAG: glycosyltransferase [Gaiellaceae bacterium]